MELGPERFNHCFPVIVIRQTSAWSTPNTVLAIKLDVKRIIDVAARTNSNPNAVCEGGWVIRGSGRRFRFRLVKLKTNLGQVVKLGNCCTIDLGLDTAFHDTIE